MGKPQSSTSLKLCTNKLRIIRGNTKQIDFHLKWNLRLVTSNRFSFEDNLRTKGYLTSNKTAGHYFNISVKLEPWSGEGNGTPLQYSCLSGFTFTFHFHALEKEMAPHSSVLAWRIPGTGEPGGLPSLGLHRVGHDWSDLAAAEPWKTFSRRTDLFFCFATAVPPHLFQYLPPSVANPRLCLSPLLGYEFLESRNLFFLTLLFVFGHVGPSSSCVEQWLLHSCGAQAPHCVAALVVECGL